MAVWHLGSPHGRRRPMSESNVHRTFSKAAHALTGSILSYAKRQPLQIVFLFLELVKGIDRLPHGSLAPRLPTRSPSAHERVKCPPDIFQSRSCPHGFDSMVCKKTTFTDCLFVFGASEGNRTPNLLITNELLCH